MRACLLWSILAAIAAGGAEFPRLIVSVALGRGDVGDMACEFQRCISVRCGVAGAARSAMSLFACLV